MKNDFWERNAGNWAAAIDQELIASRVVTNAALLQILSDYSVHSVLDIGCGEGWLARALARAPSCQSSDLQYMGIDGSQALIERAQTLQKNFPFAKVSYEEVVRGSWQAPQKYEAVVFNFSLLDEAVESVLRASRSFLSSEGHVFLQTLHPFFALPNYESGLRTEDFRSMKIPFHGEMPWYGRTLQDWSQLFWRAGYFLREIREPRSEAFNNNTPASVIFVLSETNP